MPISRLTVRNFKRFEEARFDLGNFNVLAGRNNSGKSTILQAMSLLQFCVRNTLKPRNGNYTLANVSLGAQEFAVIPVAEPIDLWKDRKALDGVRPIKIEIQARLHSGTEVLFTIDLSFNRFGIQPELLSGSEADLAALNIALVPGYAGFLPREERRTPAVRQNLVAQGQHGEIIRNLLLDLRDSESSYQEFLSLLSFVFPDISLQAPTFDEKTDLYIAVRYQEEVLSGISRRASKGLDLISAGSGFHQFLQIFSYVLSTRSTTLLLDEPDAHLFPDLQHQTLRLLQSLVKDKKIHQVLLATHSPEIISRVPPSEILFLSGDALRPLAQRSDVPLILQELGSVDNLALLNLRISGRLVMVENREDEQILSQFLRTLWGPALYSKFSSRVVFLPLNGTPLNRDVDSIVNAFRFVLGSDSDLRCFVIGDRDYLFAQQIEELLAARNRKPNQQWAIWERTEIENYLLDAGAIARLCSNPAGQTLFDIPEDQISGKLDELIESSRESALEHLMNRFKTEEPKRETSTCYRMAKEYLDLHWSGDQRLQFCDAKEIVLPNLRNWLQATAGISFSNATLAREIAFDSIPADMRSAADALRLFAGL